MGNRKNVLVLAFLGGLGISAASAEHPDSLKGVKSAVSMQQSTPQQTPPPDAVASTDTPAERPALTTALPPRPDTTPDRQHETGRNGAVTAAAGGTGRASNPRTGTDAQEKS